ncbi:MAG TPA: dienelactone hydrolase family protein, partial [Pedobacter sp.]
RMIILYRQLLNVYKQLKANKSPYSHNSGTFIRTYTSEIDNSVQNYILHVPKSYSEGKKFPVIFNTAIASSKTPYLESIRVNNSYVILNYGELANKYNVLVAELNGRTTDKHNYNTIEETEFFEVLKSIKEDYSVDSSRVYLTGFCMGGWSALKLATKYPDKFAAISLNASGYKLSDIDNKWLKQNEPLKYLSNLKNVPILQVHSELDHHTDIEIGDVLNYEMKKNDLDRVTYNRLPPGARYFYTEGFEFYDQSFAYLCKQKISAPTEVHFTTGHLKNNHAYWVKLNAISYSREASIHAKIRDNFLAINCKNVISYSIDLKQLPYQKDRRLRIVENGKEVYYALARKSNLTFNKQPGTRVNLSKTHNVEGPLAHVFTRKFVLVTGTLGNQIEDKRLNSLADSIDTLWSNRYLVSCNRKMDIDITKKDFLNSNLILLGNAGSNSIIHRIIKNIPLKIASDYIQVGDKRLLGNRLGFYMVYPNPLNSRKYIAIIGYNNPSYMSLGFERFDGITFRDISNYGWYDYKIWQVSNQEDALIGYFNSTWNTTNK